MILLRRKPSALQAILLTGSLKTAATDSADGWMVSWHHYASDRHAVLSRQRSDKFSENHVISKASARQHKDATDLVCQPLKYSVNRNMATMQKAVLPRVPKAVTMEAK